MVPGFSFAGGGGGWYGKDEEGDGGLVPNVTSENGYGKRASYSDNAGGGSTDDFIPGFGASENTGPSSVAPKQSGPLPSQEDMARVTGNEPQWSRGGGRGAGAGGASRQSRWGPRGGPRY
jgi:polyadenylation factor subunit 2